MNKSLRHSYDIIIVGTGPAGATLAYELASKGITVLLLEKEKLPRYKACAGGVTFKAAKLLAFDISPVVESVINGLRFSYKCSHQGTRLGDKPLVYTVMREKFDYFLVEKAQDAGAAVLDEQKVVQVRIETGKATVYTQNHTFTARVIVGADGANSTIARELGLMRGVGLNLGLEAEVYVDGEVLSRWDNLTEIDLGSVPPGYAWIFPKKNHLSIGVVGPLRSTKRMRTYLNKLLESQNLGNYKVSTLRAGLLPVRKRAMPITAERALLIGDAAGLTDALTGEGIYYAIKSAQLAAPVITGFLQGDIIDFQDYEKAIDIELMPELRITRAFARMSTWSPYLRFRLLKDSDWIWRTLCRIVRGEQTYVGLQATFRPFQFLLNLVSR